MNKTEIMVHSENRQGTRELIIRVLKTRGDATVLGLADQVGVSPVTVRHHLSSLQADGLVGAKIERRAVGRPHHVYYLTDAGEELLPQQYLGFSRRLLERISGSFSPELVSQLFEGMAREIVGEHAHRLRETSPAERMRILAEILQAEGFLISWEQHGDEYRIIEYNCPYRRLAQDYPVVCQLDKAVIMTVLQAPAERVQYRIEGAAHCAFRIALEDIAQGAEHERE